MMASTVKNGIDRLRNGNQQRRLEASICSVTNLVPRAHVPFGQHQGTELWNNQQARSQSPRVLLNAFVERIHIDFIYRRHLNQATHAP